MVDEHHVSDERDLADLIDRLTQRLDVQDETIASQSELISKQSAVIEEQAARIDDLERRLAQDSSNSSKPPSSDSPWAKRRKGRRPPSDKRQGAQPGHPGRAREPTPPEDVDEIVDHEPDRCTRCGHDELLVLGSPRVHQVVEIPQVVATVTEHRMHRACCAACGEEVVAPHPIGVPRSNFGPRLHAVTANLLAGYRMSRREARDWLLEQCGVRVSVGGVSNMERRVSRALAKPYEAALVAAKRSPVLNVDETPWKLAGALQWLWTAVGERVTVHLIHHRRNREAMRSLIDKGFDGLWVTDRLATYDEVPPDRRQLCWAHLERDFRALAQGPHDCRSFGETGLDIAQAILRAARHRKDHGDDERMQRELMPHFERLIELLVDGAASDTRGVTGMSINLLRRIESLWVFADHPDVPPTNNLAERAIRKAVLWRKGSFGSQSERGLRFVERMLTVIATLRRTGRDVLGYLTEAVQAANRGHAAPTLLARG